jgi:hypothetical protein
MIFKTMLKVLYDTGLMIGLSPNKHHITWFATKFNIYSKTIMPSGEFEGLVTS